MVDYKKGSSNQIKEFKNEVLIKINDYLDEILDKDQKKCALITYWLRDYYNYIKSENTFCANRLPVYKKGSIIEVNFGYRVGSEFGGRHYAIVLDKKNSKNSPIVTVIPLSSIKENKTKFRYTEVNLGTAVYDQLYNKFNSILKDIINYAELINLLKENIDLFEANGNMLELLIEPMLKKIPTLKNVSTEQNLSNFLNNLNNEMNKIVSLTNATINRIERMNRGSYALINQITTISKQRIIDPVTRHSSLNGIILPKEYIDKIDKKIKTFI